MSNYPKRLDRRLLLAVSLGISVLVGAPASAQQSPDWTLPVVSTLQSLQARSQCFKTPKHQRHVHILGIEAGDNRLSELQRSQILNRLNTALAQATQNRITRASTFRHIAGAAGAFDKSAAIRIADLDERAGTADLTVLLRPLTVTDKDTTIEFVIWTNDRDDGGNGTLSCIEPSNIVVPFELEQDPRCHDAWTTARNVNTSEEYGSFLRYFGDCREAELAREAQRRIENETCDNAWAEVAQQNDLAGYRAFVAENESCTAQIQLARGIIQVRETELAAQRERDEAAKQQREATMAACAVAWDAARQIGSLKAYQTFLTAKPDCSDQIALAAEAIRNLQQKVASCISAHSAADAVGTIEALRQFVAANVQCSEQASAAQQQIAALEAAAAARAAKNKTRYHYVGPDLRLKRVRLRSKPRLISSVIKSLPENTLFEVVEERDKWLFVRLRNGQEGWVYKRRRILCCKEIDE